MDSTCMMSFKYGESCVVTRFDEFSSFQSLVNHTCSRWSFLKREDVLFTYAFGDKHGFQLINDEDFKSMCIMVDRFKIEWLEINVIDRAICVRNDVLGEQSNSVEGSVASEMDDSRNDVNVSFFRHRDKKLKSSEWADVIQTVGQAFEGGVAEFRNALCKFSSEIGFDFEYVKNEPGRVTAECLHKISKDCPWRIHATLENSTGFFYIRTYNPKHTCKDVVKAEFGQRIGSEVLSSLLLEKVRDDPNAKPNEILKELQTEYGLQMHYKVVWRAVEKAKKIVFGDASLAYDKLRSYFGKIKLVDPTSDLFIECDPDTSRFKRCFIAFGASLHGFTFCRPLLFLDGTFLTGMYRGTLLAATAKDGNNGLFPIALAIVENEDVENWCWFIENLRRHIADRGVTFVSDRHPGIINAVREKMPFSHHSFCLFHLKNNLRSKLGGLSKEVRSNVMFNFTKLAKAPTPALFEKYLTRITNEGGTKVVEFLNHLPKENFATAHFGGCRYGEMCSNAAESFNSMIKQYKSLPVVELLDHIRMKFMERMAKRRHDSAKWANILCPSIDKKYKQLLDEGRSWAIYPSNDFEYEVHSDPKMVVNIHEFTCSCGMWQHEGFPCNHSVAVLSRYTDDPSVYIEEYFKSVNYRSSYSRSIPAISTFDDPVDSNEDVVLPPLAKRPPGRPKKNRYPSRGEITKRKMKCSRCHKEGYHNRRSCKEPLQIELS